jgi:hypothetical protein
MIAQTLHHAICETAVAALAEGRCTAADIALRVLDSYPELVEAESERLIKGRIREISKRVLRELSDEDEHQAVLPGFALPATIAVPREDGEFVYVRTDTATWVDLQAGVLTRNLNIKRAVEKRQAYLRILDRLKPWMAKSPDMTVQEAMHLEAERRRASA